jgi:hypothetical protein
MVYLTYGQINHHNQIEWLKDIHVFQGPGLQSKCTHGVVKT